jgi:peptidoglycan/LPS O-acetylase OafA/YrhL
MEQLTLTTPALLFSAISLILLAYTNRFLAYAQVVRSLHTSFKENPNSLLLGQIQNLRKRLQLTKTMQILGISSLLLCVICMFLIYVNFHIWAEALFGIALVLLILSLAISIREIQISVKALDLHLNDME